MCPEIRYEIDGKPFSVAIARSGDSYTVTIGERVYQVDARLGDSGRVDMTVDGLRVRAYVAVQSDETFVGLDGQTWTLAKHAPQRRHRGASGARASGALTAAMPGLVLDVLVRPGDQVAKGAPLVLMEAMKMELRITAPHAGTVQAVDCHAGEIVQRGQLLVEVEPKHDE